MKKNINEGIIIKKGKTRETIEQELLQKGLTLGEINDMMGVFEEDLIDGAGVIVFENLLDMAKKELSAMYEIKEGLFPYIDFMKYAMEAYDDCNVMQLVTGRTVRVLPTE